MNQEKVSHGSPEVALKCWLTLPEQSLLLVPVQHFHCKTLLDFEQGLLLERYIERWWRRCAATVCTFLSLYFLFGGCGLEVLFYL